MTQLAGMACSIAEAPPGNGAYSLRTPTPQADDVPDEAEEAGEGADMELEGSRAIEPQQHAASEQRQAGGAQP